MSHSEILIFVLFNLFVILLLFLDLKVIGRKNHVIKFKEATLWSLFWILVAIAFYFLIRHHGDWIHGVHNAADVQKKIDLYGHPININGLTDAEALTIYRKNLSLEYITGYLIEKSLSVDNLFVMIMIFYAFGVQKKYYKRVLFWGILGALVMRFIFIFGSALLIQKFDWILYIFGGILLYTGVKMFIDRNKKETQIDVSKHPMVKFSSRYLRVFPRYVGNRFYIKSKDGKFLFTPLFVVVLVIEFSDLIFAVDSIPAIFSVTKDPYIVFFSNVFAILGLRSLFFLLINVVELFHYLKHGLSVLLVFIGLKLVLHPWTKEIGFTTEHSLYFVLTVLVISIALSLLFPKKKIAEK